MAEENKDVGLDLTPSLENAAASIFASQELLKEPEIAEAFAAATASIKSQLGIDIPEEILIQIGTMFTLPDEHFDILAGEFCSAFEKSLNSAEDKISICQMLNVSNVKAEDLLAAREQWMQFVDDSFSKDFSENKRTFLKRLFTIIVNAVMDSEGIAKRIITIPIEITEDATIPTYAVVGDAGVDVYTTCDVELAPGETKIVPTGIKVELPLGYEIQVRPRSGLSAKSKIRIANAPGTIDSNYRGEIGIICENIAPKIKDIEIDPETEKVVSIAYNPSEFIEKGQRIAQLVLSEVPTIKFDQVDSLNPSNRGEGGFGSTGA